MAVDPQTAWRVAYFMAAQGFTVRKHEHPPCECFINVLEDTNPPPASYQRRVYHGSVYADVYTLLMTCRYALFQQGMLMGTLYCK